jgi:ASC-1-like (ASCH) protein
MVWQQKDETAARKVQEKAYKQKRRQDIATGNAVAFTGSLVSKKVAELRDIAYALGLKDDGKKESLVSSIRSHLELHAELRTKAWFAGLYVSCG